MKLNSYFVLNPKKRGVTVVLKLASNHEMILNLILPF